MSFLSELFADKMRARRKKLGLTQAEAAIEIGTDPPNVSRWESGQYLPTEEALKSIGRVYGWTKDNFLDNDTDVEEIISKAAMTAAKEAAKMIRYRKKSPDPNKQKLYDFIDRLNPEEATELFKATDIFEKGKKSARVGKTMLDSIKDAVNRGFSGNELINAAHDPNREELLRLISALPPRMIIELVDIINSRAIFTDNKPKVSNRSK